MVHRAGLEAPKNRKISALPTRLHSLNSCAACEGKDVTENNQDKPRKASCPNQDLQRAKLECRHSAATLRLLTTLDVPACVQVRLWRHWQRNSVGN